MKGSREETDPRLAWLALGLGMLASLAYCLHVARGTTFTADELAWVSISPNMDLRAALEPHAGHLVLVSHLLYGWVLETIGTDYLTFRLLTLGAVFLAVALTFAFLRRRVGPWVALAPCLVLLFFGNDTGHLLQGNGFTIMLAMACGVGALLAMENGARGWDVAACALLCLGVLTYTVALPFLAGAIVLVALLPAAERWRRAWVPALPLALYLAWRVWVEATGADLTRGGIEPINLLLLPEWTLVSVGGAAAAMAGLNYDFTGGGWVQPDEMAGPALGLLLLAALGWRISRGGLDRWFWITSAVALALFASQVLTWIPGVREPGTSRYMYPDAIALLLVAAEAARGLRLSRAALAAVWAVAATGLATNAMIVRDSGAALRDRAPDVRAQVTATDLLARNPVRGPGAVSILELVSDTPIAFTSDATVRYDGLTLSPEELRSQPEPVRAKVDSMLAQGVGAALARPVIGERGECRRARSVGGGPISVPLPPEAVLSSPGGGEAAINRFSSQPIEVGALTPGVPAALAVGEDGTGARWTVTVDARRLTVCELLG